MRLAPCIGLAAIGLTLAGCATFGKKSTPPAGQAAPDRGAPTIDQLGAGPSDRGAPPAGMSGLLAGQVIDGYNRRPPATYIQVVEARDRGPVGQPMEVAVDSQGYFTIGGLQPGRHYQLIARARSGDRVLAGATWATPPDPKVLIRISEDFATSTTPPLPGAPAWPGPAAASAVPPSSPPLPVPVPGLSDQGWAPGRPPAPYSQATVPPYPAPSSRGADLGAPNAIPGAANAAIPAPAAPPPVANRPENIVDGSDKTAMNRPILGEIPSQARPAVPRVAPVAPGPEQWALADGPAHVPSCVLTGQTLYNFALNGVDGRPWEYRRDHRGRLVLIDFWGTWCVHCLHAIPHLNILNQRYGPAGLEVIGIAYEDGSPAEQAVKVNRVRDRLHMGYRILLGSGRNQPCPVRSQFGVGSWPTLVLLDEGGHIIWRGEGFDAQQIRDLDIIIRQRLGVR